MFDNYSYKKKCIALGAVFVLLSATAYKRSFKGLFEVIAENQKLSNTSKEYGSKSKSFDELLKEITILDKVIGKEGITKEEVQQNIVNFTGSKHSGVSINDLQPIHVFLDENYRIVTNQLDLTGTINQLLNVAYDFEKEFKFSRIVSMNFYTLKNNKSEVLHLKIIFQNYENNK